MAPSLLPGVQVWLRLVGYSLAAFCCTVLHIVFLPLVAVAGIVPDLLLLLVFWIALREGQIAGTLAGFAIGVLMDLVLPGALGLSAFAKTLAGFVVGFFAPVGNDDLRMMSIGKLLSVVALGSGVHNVVYFALFVHPMDVNPVEFVLKYAGASTGYTLVVATLLVLGLQLWWRRRVISER